MEIENLYPGSWGSNCYLLTVGTHAALVDPSANASTLMDAVAQKGALLDYILLTHGHFDHIMAAADFQASLIPIYMHEADEALVNGSGNLAKYIGLKMQPFSVDNRLIEGDLDIYGFNLRVIETPGHTAGSVCIQIENVIFTGDTLFLDSYGRTDFPSGNQQELIESARKLFALPGDFLIYSGHGESTTLERERRHNAINYLF